MTKNTKWRVIPETKEEFLAYESESVDSTLLKAIGLQLINTNSLLNRLLEAEGIDYYGELREAEERLRKKLREATKKDVSLPSK